MKSSSLARLCVGTASFLISAVLFGDQPCAPDRPGSVRALSVDVGLGVRIRDRDGLPPPAGLAKCGDLAGATTVSRG